MDYSSYEQYFSSQRMSRYLKSFNGNREKATQLYDLNIQLSEAYPPILSILEVALRNGIDCQLAKYFSDPLWLITQRNGFANHPQMTYITKKGIHAPDFFFSEKVSHAESKLIKRGIQVTHGKLLADLTFGFWVKFFDKQPIKILKGVQIQAFKNSPKMPMAQVHSHLNRIVGLRNRISHNEPICFDRMGLVCLTTIAEYEAEISSALMWISTEIKNWSDDFNRVQQVVGRIAQL